MTLEAAAWVTRLTDSDVAIADQAAFEAWRKRSPRHEVAYQTQLALWEGLDRLRALRPVADLPDPDLLLGLDLGIDDTCAPTQQAYDSAVRTAPSRALRRRAAVAVIAIVAVGAAGGGAALLSASPSYATTIGQRRTIVLSDNTRVELNTDTKIQVWFTRGVRQVRLIRGEALFVVQGDSRPFVVKTPDARLRTAGSQLSVHLTPGQTDVLVSDGAVEVEQGPNAKLLSLVGGASVRIGGVDPSVNHLSASEIDRAMAWRQGAIALDGRSLAAAALEFNRYNVRKIVVQDPAVAALRVGGYFHTDDLQGFVSAVSDSFDLKVSERPDGAIQLSRRIK